MTRQGGEGLQEGGRDGEVGGALILEQSDGTEEAFQSEGNNKGNNPLGPCHKAVKSPKLTLHCRSRCTSPVLHLSHAAIEKFFVPSVPAPQ
eukprot:CAMPEP_0114169668 /NCGR_PEP_ID=MMETSP0043_2-20121206/33692_1 /TAXON_ID=464988 /ORGANISM="Hemiselmis andersenii, Strain CCMP644" /LENGTH=90 /DNA_ID=CAMNT_0001267147 /DNA_START=240 /DNA_END=509 /DNA_ORIENTATION=-